MPFKCKIAEKEYYRQYNEKNKEKKQQQAKEWREKNKEKLKEQSYIYVRTEVGMKGKRIGRWKERGVVDNNFDELYDYYLSVSNCEECDVELTTGKRSNTTRCLDHCHKTGLFRNVLCLSCNVKRRLI